MKRLPGVGDGTDLYALTDDALSLGRPVLDVAKALLGAGIRILQYREKDKKAGRMLEECRALRELTRAAGACLIVNDHVDIALLCEADGVHVGRFYTALRGRIENLEKVKHIGDDYGI